MISQAMRDAIATIEANALTRPSSAEFEMAYQVRVAMERIRCAIRVVEMSGHSSEVNMDALSQLVDALDRLDAAERHFQDRWRRPVYPTTLPLREERAGVNGRSGHNS